MSTDKTQQNKPADAEFRKNLNVADAPEKQQPAIEKLNVSALRIDESFDGDNDPYNSTGQYLAAKIRDRYEEE